MRETPPPISIIIVTKDIGRDLSPIFEQSLIYVEYFDDVWVINSGDNPNTEPMAKRHNATFKSFHWNGLYPKKRQWCLDNIPTKHNWVFFLDADELMFPDITQEISQLLRTLDIEQYAGFFVRSGYIWDGQPLKHGLKNNKIVLLHKHLMEYPIINDLGCKIMGEIEGHYQP
ncbi:MAG: glycosyltransferase family 2 protein, partial [Alphaproteobacteria bacterium]|nr:glycosyltransferase family 2 protein [Alphaproteobacteria bacterium]